MKKINIPIHRHTPKRYRQSHWELREPWWGCPEPLNTLYLVTDLQRVPKKKGIGLDFAFSQDFKDAIQEAFDD